MDYINSKLSSRPNLATEYEQLGSLFDNKLWHELTNAIEAFLDNPKNASENFLELYKEFISKFEGRLNQLRLAHILSRVADSLRDPAAAITFFSEALSGDSRKKLGKEAALCLDIDIAHATLKLGLPAESKKLLDDLQENLSKISTSETMVYSKFYQASTELRKVIGPPQEFYQAALQYLAYTSLESLRTEQKYELATDIALAAAASEGIYNFGEVLTNPILAALKDTPNAWLYSLMVCMHHGNINDFNRIIGTFREQYMAQPALSASLEIVKRKIVLLCLVTMVFERHPHDRVLTFAEVATRTQVPLAQVEWVLMSALSKGLIRGDIDEVAQTIEVSWVLPRVLEVEQLKLLAKQLTQWAEKTKGALVTVEERAPDLMM